MASDPKCTGPIIPSSCVFYTGPVFTFLASDNQPACDATINDVFKKIDIALKTLIDGNNLTGLSKDCLDFIPATVTPAQLHQVEITQICLNKGAIESLSEQFNEWDISTEVIEIALPTCLQDLASPCAVGTNQYKLIELLTLFANTLCDYETRISNLE